MNRQQIKNFLDERGSKLTSITFRKLSDGSFRKLTVNPASTKGIKGTPRGVQMSKTRKENNSELIVVRDMKDGWRSFHASQVFMVKCGENVLKRPGFDETQV